MSLSLKTIVCIVAINIDKTIATYTEVILYKILFKNFFVFTKKLKKNDWKKVVNLFRLEKAYFFRWTFLALSQYKVLF